MPWKFDPNPGQVRVVAIGLLILAEGVLIPVYGTLSQGQWPTPIQLATALTSGAIQLVTYWLGFLRKREKVEEE